MTLARLTGNALTLAARYIIPLPCDACGDDIDLHQCIDVDEKGVMVNCDRR